MIEITKTHVYGWEEAFRGMRNPMDSWSRSDSLIGKNMVQIGEADKELALKLIRGGAVHSKFMRMITVTADIKAPQYWWSEYDTYKVGTVANSCSKMHRLLSKPFEVSDFSFDKLDGYRNDVKQFIPELDENMIENEVFVRFDKDYGVSQYGRIKNCRTNRILGMSKHQDGYLFVTIHGEQIPAHRIVAKIFLKDTYADDLVVNHKDGNKMNNFVENLEWVTQSENIRHSIENHLTPNTVNTYKGKFTPEQRDQIKEKWENGETKRSIANKYGVSHTCICDIINDKYKYVSKVNTFEEVAKPLVDILNELRDAYFLTEDEKEKKELWYEILQLMPISYNQLRTVQLNYEVLRNIYRWRKDHKLDEWRTFCDWIKTLPYSELITEGIDDGND